MATIFFHTRRPCMSCESMLGLSHNSWTPVECGLPFEDVGAFCSDFIPNDKAYGSKQF